MFINKFSSIKEAELAVGGLSSPSKMPSYAWSISAKQCNTGSKLAKVKGSVCYNCYALKGRYMFNNVQGALNRRLDAWSSDRDKWKDAMIYLMHNKQHIVNTGHFRFFDSGDLQGIDMLNDINVVAWASPNIQFWLPTKEYKLIKDYKGHTHYSTVYTKDNLHMAKGYVCPASKQGNVCGSCRACWSDKVSEVSYVAH